MSTQKLNKINLLPRDSFEESSLGKFLSWALTSGRVIVILTEFVVVLAFGSRFWFDQKLNNLIEEISAKEAVVESYVSIENQMRDVLARETKVSDFLVDGLELPDVFSNLRKATPKDVSFDTFSINDSQIKIEGSAKSEAGFSLFLNNLGYIPGVTNIKLGKTVFDERSGGVNFDVLINLTNDK